MELTDALGTYDPTMVKAFFVSAILFLLYSVINLIDTSSYIKDYNILDINSTPRGRLVYAYMSGYFMFILKAVLALVTLFVLILIIRIAVATLIHIFTAIKKKKQKGGAGMIASSMVEGTMGKVEEAVHSNIRWFLAFVTSKPFIIVFLVIIPIFLFFVLLAYSRFYNPEHIKETSLDKAPRIMGTHHAFLMFLISSLFAISFIYTVYLWFRAAFAK